MCPYRSPPVANANTARRHQARPPPPPPSRPACVYTWTAARRWRRMQPGVLMTVMRRDANVRLRHPREGGAARWPRRIAHAGRIGWGPNLPPPRWAPATVVSHPPALPRPRPAALPLRGGFRIREGPSQYFTSVALRLNDGRRRHQGDSIKKRWHALLEGGGATASRLLMGPARALTHIPDPVSQCALEAHAGTAASWWAHGPATRVTYSSRRNTAGRATRGVPSPSGGAQPLLRFVVAGPSSPCSPTDQGKGWGPPP